LSAEMLPMKIDEGLVNDHAQPYKGGCKSILRKSMDAFLCVHVRVLQDVIGPEPTPQASIDTKIDHSPEPIPML